MYIQLGNQITSSLQALRNGFSCRSLVSMSTRNALIAARSWVQTSAQLKSTRFLSGRGSSVAGRSGWSGQLRISSVEVSVACLKCARKSDGWPHASIYTSGIYIYTHTFMQGNPPHQGFNLVINDHCYQLTTDRRSLRADALRLCYFLWLASGIAKTLTFERGYWNPRATGETTGKTLSPVAL